MSEEAYATFHTTHAALRAERAVQRAGIPARLVPTPRELSADCTLALRFGPDQEQRVREILAGVQVQVQGIHRLGMG